MTRSGGGVRRDRLIGKEKVHFLLHYKRSDEQWEWRMKRNYQLSSVCYSINQTKTYCDCVMKGRNSFRSRSFLCLFQPRSVLLQMIQLVESTITERRYFKIDFFLFLFTLLLLRWRCIRCRNGILLLFSTSWFGYKTNMPRGLLPRLARQSRSLRISLANQSVAVVGLLFITINAVYVAVAILFTCALDGYKAAAPH